VSYEVHIRPGLLDPGDPTLATACSVRKPGSGRRLVVIETRVHALYAERVTRYLAAQDLVYDLCVIDADEPVKNIDSVLHVVASMDRFGVARRRDPVIAIGGGVLTDIVGLATSLYRRSTPYVRVPTTLVGMVDAGIGAKTGVNHGAHKNRLGSYHPAAVTLIDPTFLGTLDERQLGNGFAEILKISLVRDAELFELLVAHGPRLVAERMQSAGSADHGALAAEVLQRAIHNMLQELQPNLWELQLQRPVDFGHSFSPTIEMAALPELLHGEAVSIDMLLTTVLAHRRGLVSARQLDRVRTLLCRLGLPLWHPICTPDLMHQALSDTVEHRDGRQLLPVPVGIGAVRFVDDVSPEELDAAVAQLQPLASGVSAGSVAPGVRRTSSRGPAVDGVRAVLLAGGEGRRMGSLAEGRSKSLIPFGGTSRLIDFSIANVRQSGLDEVLLLSQHGERQLMDELHLAWNTTDGFGVHFGPYQRAYRDALPGRCPVSLPERTGRVEQGTADALIAKAPYIFGGGTVDVLVLHTDHVYRIDYREMVEQHHESGAALTVSYQRIDRRYVHLFGMVEFGPTGELTAFVEKPEEPTGDLVFAAFCLFDAEVLHRYLELLDGTEWRHDISRDIIPAMLAAGEHIRGYPVTGYWEDIGTVERYLRANLRLLDPEPSLALADLPRTVLPGVARRAVGSGADRSIVAADVRGDGRLVHSIAFPGVHVGTGATVRDSVLLPGARVADGAQIDSAVVLEDGSVVQVGEPLAGP
jgi:ADP-glucose pyrophosphorylase/3-dehydroquinate synthetase